MLKAVEYQWPLQTNVEQYELRSKYNFLFVNRIML
jgi:hypothetical protein